MQYDGLNKYSGPRWYHHLLWWYHLTTHGTTKPVWNRSQLNIHSTKVCGKTVCYSNVFKLKSLLNSADISTLCAFTSFLLTSGIKVSTWMLNNNSKEKKITAALFVQDCLKRKWNLNRHDLFFVVEFSEWKRPLLDRLASS